MATCEILEWDSRFFGRAIARLYGKLISASDLKDAFTWCQQHQIACLVYLAEIDEIDARRELEDAGFHLQDIRVTLQHDQPGPLAPPEGSRTSIRSATLADLPALEAIAAHSYQQTRFYNDPKFGADQASALYRTWIRNSVNGYADLVLTAEWDGIPAGYITCHMDSQQLIGRIGLVGVSEPARGIGTGTKLVNHALKWFQSQNAAAVQVVTQAANLSAIRLYQHTGFFIQDVSLWYHRWFEHPPKEHGFEQLSYPFQ